MKFATKEEAEAYQAGVMDGIMQSQERWNQYTRFEVINHGAGAEQFGRILAMWGVRLEPSVQDGGRTLKVFVYDRQGGYGVPG